MANEVDDAAEAKHQAEPTSSSVSRPMWIASVLLAGLVAGVAGAAIGWKVEQGRVKDDVKSIRPIGVVRESDDDSVRISLLTASGSRTYAITDETVIAGSDGEGVEEGAIVLIRGQSVDGESQAREIIILPDSTTYADRAAASGDDG